MRSLSRQFLLYLVCAGSAAGVNFLAGFLLVQRAGFQSGLGYPLAVAAGYSLGMVVNFSLNRRFTFSANQRTQLDQARTFVIVALSGLMLTTALAALLRSALALVLPHAGALSSAETMAQLLTIGAVSIYSFAAHRYFTFHHGLRYGLVKFAKFF